MNTQKKILSVQDISCYGKCSNTVMMPLLSAAGLETVMLPTALLSTHTGGFSGFTFLDLTDEMKKMIAHWESIGLKFDMLCTGYFGSAEQIDHLIANSDKLFKPSALKIIDTVMGDNGALYGIYDNEFVNHMRELCRGAYVITPNITEACLLAGMDYIGCDYDPDKFAGLIARLEKLGVENILLTGVLFGDGTIGVIGHEVKTKKQFFCSSRFVNVRLHGTGDVLTGALIAYISRGLGFEEAAKKAEKFVAACIDQTEPCIGEHWYGLKFEPCIPLLFE